MIKIFGVRPWAVIVGVLTVLSAGIGAGLVLRSPPPPEPCRDAVAILCAGQATCDFGEQRMEIKPIAATCIMATCTCPRQP